MRGHQATFNPSTLQPTTISVNGYKHLLVGVINACVATPLYDVTITNVPDIEDTRVLIEILGHLGAQIAYENHTLRINTQALRYVDIDESLSQRIHGAIYLLPALLGRFHQISLGNCGGCSIGENSKIGKRPVNHMLSVLEKFGATFTNSATSITGHSTAFKACQIDIMEYSSSQDCLTGPHVSGASKTAILAALSVENGTTIIDNIYPKPDVTELLQFVSQIGFIVTREGNRVSITRKDHAQNVPVEFRVLSDLSEIMTWITFATYHEVNIRIANVDATCIEALRPELVALDKMGIGIDYAANTIQVKWTKTLNPINLIIKSTEIYSDHQPFFGLLLSKANGMATIADSVWTNRFSYVPELQKLGIDVHMQDNCLHINHGHHHRRTSHPCLNAHDLRAAALLCLVAIKYAPCKVSGLEHIIRGYENFSEKLEQLGVLYETD